MEHTDHLNQHQATEYNNFSKQERKRMCRQLLTDEKQMERLIVQYFEPEDYFAINDRLIGTGKIGGKACGFLLGRKIIQAHLPDASEYMEEHNSFYVGTDVFYRYMIENNCWPLHVRHLIKKNHPDKMDQYREALARGHFPESTRSQFRTMLTHYGNAPIIIRSSSVMEDGFGNAFSGKYESVFCTNQGNIEERLLAFEQAVRTVYASTLAPAALEYRKKRGLLGRDEQMAILVQQVAGIHRGELFFPMAAGVSFSYNPYRWMEHINPNAGMVRLVAGLGTRAVNRTPGDYPRLVGFDRPQAMRWPTTRESHKYSQRYLDALNLSTGQIETIKWEQALPLMSAAERKYIFSHDTEAEDYLMEMGRYREVLFVDCQGIVNCKAYVEQMKEMLTVLEECYDCPVDIEFALAARTDGSIGINLLQCRPLQYRQTPLIAVPEHQDSDVIFEVSRASMRSSKVEQFDLIVFVDPKQYYQMPHNDKSRIAAAVSQINQQLGDHHAMMFVPGRIGTSSPELGVPVNYTEISRFRAICEVSSPDTGHQPELSYGSHMFQDMVEADVFYAAIHNDSSTKRYQPELLSAFPDICPEMLSRYPDTHHVIRIYDLSGRNASLYLDASKGHALCILNPLTT